MTATANVNVEPISSPLNAVELVRVVSAAATTLLVTAAVFVFWRRLTGAIAAPLPATEMLLAGVLMAGLGWTARLHATFQRPAITRRVAVSVAMLVLGLALSRADGSAVALIVFWAFISGEEFSAWLHVRPAHIRGKSNRTLTPPGLDRSIPEHETGEVHDPVEPSADIVQQLTLRTTAEGGQELSGWLRMNLSSGQRTGTLHVAFCPPFDRPPVVEVEAVAGPDCRIKVAEAQTYGVRLDVKLSVSAVEEESVLVWFFASREPA